MATSTVNISDFRCRGIKARLVHQTLRAAGQRAELVVVEPEHREVELLQEALISENPSVFDIGIAREAQRMRQRLMFRPIAMYMYRHRANVIRFGEPGVTVMQPKGSSTRIQRTSASQDRDFPPAA
jgi:hypothetical protein